MRCMCLECLLFECSFLGVCDVCETKSSHPLVDYYDADSAGIFLAGRCVPLFLPLFKIAL